MRRKVLYVITKSNWGGAQRYVFDLATHLPKEDHRPGRDPAIGGGFEVAVALGGTGEKNASVGRLEADLKSANVRTIFVKSFMRDISFGKDARVGFELLDIFKKERPSVVHLNSTKAGLAGAVAARLAGVPRIIFTAHGWPFRENRNPIIRAVLWLASWATALCAHRVICVSEYDLVQAKQMPFVGHKAVRIYNGIEEMHLGSGEVIRNAFPPGVTITGTIGELNDNKNQQALIEQAAKKSDMYVAIVGEGENRTFLEELIAKYNLEARVKLFGFIPATEVLKGFDTFALPSIKEGLPYVLIQAKFAGLPISANRVGGVGEVLDAKNMSDFTLEEMLKKTLELYR